MGEERKRLIVDGIIARLEQIGYSTVSEDITAFMFMLDYTLDYIKIQCNREDVDPACDSQIVEKIVADFLIKKKNMGLLENFDYDRGVKAITEGDTKVEFLTGDDAPTMEGRFNRCLNEMSRGFDKRCISPFRKLRW